MKSKLLKGAFVLALLMVGLTSASLEARSHISFNFANVFAPAPCVRERVVVESYPYYYAPAPAYVAPAPVYVAPAPCYEPPVVYVAPRPVYREVYVERPVYRSGFSFGFGSCWR